MNNMSIGLAPTICKGDLSPFEVFKSNLKKNERILFIRILGGNPEIKVGKSIKKTSIKTQDALGSVFRFDEYTFKDGSIRSINIEKIAINTSLRVVAELTSSQIRDIRALLRQRQESASVSGEYFVLTQEKHKSERVWLLEKI